MGAVVAGLKERKKENWKKRNFFYFFFVFFRWLLLLCKKKQWKKKKKLKIVYFVTIEFFNLQTTQQQQKTLKFVNHFISVWLLLAIWLFLNNNSFTFSFWWNRQSDMKAVIIKICNFLYFTSFFKILNTLERERERKTHSTLFKKSWSRLFQVYGC